MERSGPTKTTRERFLRSIGDKGTKDPRWLPVHDVASPPIQEEVEAKVSPDDATRGKYGKTLVRTYTAHQLPDAVVEFRANADDLAKLGYTPTSQTWAAGQWGCGAWLVALILCVFLIGILVFIYMLIVKPDGTLTVTYSLREDVAISAPPAPTPAAASHEDRIGKLAELHDAGVISDEEFASRRSKILDEI